MLLGLCWRVLRYSKKRAIKGHYYYCNSQKQMTTTTTTTTTTTNLTNTTTITTQRKRALLLEEKEEAHIMQQKQRECWSDRVTDALFRQLKRKVRVANAGFGTPQWVRYDPEATWFTASCDADVTRHAALAEECLDDARAHAKKKGRALLPPLEFLPRGILESEALKPYLERWKRDDDNEAAAAVAAAPTRARCAYPPL